MNPKINSLNSIHQFLHQAEGLKKLLRHSWLSDGRRESVAEHTWRTCLMAIVLKDEIDQNIDIGKVVQMLTIHDLAEIKAGDYHAFKDVPKNKHKLEKKALNDLLSELNQTTQIHITNLWNEFEDCKTIDAKFAQALDKLEVLIQHNEAGTDTWEDKEYDFNYYYADDKVTFNKVLELFRSLVLEETDNLIKEEVEI